MKKLIQILIVFGLVVVMGGGASGDSLQDGNDAGEMVNKSKRDSRAGPYLHG